jgi:hypothetical protein
MRCGGRLASAVAAEGNLPQRSARSAKRIGMGSMRKRSTKLLEVLIIGRHRDTLDRTLTSLSTLPIRIDGAISDDAAFDFLMRNRYDVISIGGGVEDTSRTRMKELLIARMPDIQVIEVPRPGAESIDVLAKKPIQMEGPDELAAILSSLLGRREKE